MPDKYLEPHHRLDILSFSEEHHYPFAHTIAVTSLYSISIPCAGVQSLGRTSNTVFFITVHLSSITFDKEKYLFPL